jgi:hypothetical protein
VEPHKYVSREDPSIRQLSSYNDTIFYAQPFLLLNANEGVCRAGWQFESVASIQISPNKCRDAQLPTAVMLSATLYTLCSVLLLRFAHSTHIAECDGLNPQTCHKILFCVSGAASSVKPVFFSACTVSLSAVSLPPLLKRSMQMSWKTCTNSPICSKRK